MPDEVKPDIQQASTQEAQLAGESITSGQEKAATVDFDADYAAAQQFSVSDVDRTDEGAQAAEAVTKPQFEVTEQEETKPAANSTGNPADYLEMAKDVDSGTEAVTEVSDDLLEKALEKGQPGQ